MLNKQKLVSNLNSIYQNIVGPNEERIRRITEQIEQTYEEEVDRNLARDAQLGPILSGIHIDSRASTVTYITEFLNQMEDMTGDSVTNRFSAGEILPFVNSINVFGSQANSGGISDGEIEGVKKEWASLWAVLVQRTFNLYIPPPGSIRKTSSIILPPTVFPDPSVLLNQANEGVNYHENLAHEFYSAASQLVHTVTYVVSSPTGPVPGPPLTTMVK